MEQFIQRLETGRLMSVIGQKQSGKIQTRDQQIYLLLK